MEGLNTGILLFLDISGGELLIIMIAIFIVFGPQRIPEMARRFGRGLHEVRQATNKIKDDISQDVKDVTEDITDTVKDASNKVNDTGDFRKNVRNKYNEKVKETPQADDDPYEELEKERTNPAGKENNTEGKGDKTEEKIDKTIKNN